jgi:alanine or glycine:cation symporter, AGCS family
MLNEMTAFFESVLLYPLFGYVPFIILWLGSIGIFLTFKLKFLNITMFPQAVKLIMRGKTSDAQKDTISPFAALMASISATVGLGSLAGTAVAIKVAGPGTIFWMMVFGILGMCVKASEVHIGHKYRQVGVDGKITGGGFYYLAQGLKNVGLPKLGIILSLFFGIFGYFAIWGMAGFQMNQLVSLITGETVRVLDNISLGIWDGHTKLGLVSAICISIFVLYILIGGVKRIGNFASAIVPAMFLIYVAGAILVLIVNSANLVPAIKNIFASAFDFSSGLAGFIVVVVIGARRGLYACEAGQGTSPIAGSNSSMVKSQEQGIVTLLDPVLVSTIMFINGLCIVSSGVFETTDFSGILLTKAAFGSVAPWLSFIITLCAVMFAFTTVMTDAYYYEKFASFLLPKLNRKIIQLSYGVMIFVFGIASATDILAFTDIFVLLMTIPNILGLYILSGEISRDFEEYKQSIKKTLEK